MLSAGGDTVMLSESLRLPPIFPVGPEAFGLLLFLTFLAPMGAALYHGLIRRDGVLSRMAGRRLP